MPHDLEEIRSMVEGGMSSAAIAEELGVSPGRVSQLLSAMGLSDSVKRKSSVTRLTEEDVQDAVAMYESGAPVAAIILKHGLNYNAFYKMLSTRGIEFRERSESGRETRKQRKDLAVKMYLKGISLAQIEIESGIRQPEIHRELHIRGIPLRRSRLLRPRDILDMEEDELDFDVDELTDTERSLLPEDDDNLKEERLSK